MELHEIAEPRGPHQLQAESFPSCVVLCRVHDDQVRAFPCFAWCVSRQRITQAYCRNPECHSDLDSLCGACCRYLPVQQLALIAWDVGVCHDDSVARRHFARAQNLLNRRMKRHCPSPRRLSRVISKASRLSPRYPRSTDRWPRSDSMTYSCMGCERRIGKIGSQRR